MPRFSVQSSAFAPHEKWRESVRDTWRQTLLYIWEKPAQPYPVLTAARCEPAPQNTAPQRVSPQT